jgi:hypothetical protein
LIYVVAFIFFHAIGDEEGAGGRTLIPPEITFRQWPPSAALSSEFRV